MDILISEISNRGYYCLAFQESVNLFCCLSTRGNGIDNECCSAYRITGCKYFLPVCQLVLINPDVPPGDQVPVQALKLIHRVQDEQIPLRVKPDQHQLSFLFPEQFPSNSGLRS